MEIAKERYDQERLGVFASLSSAVDYEAQHRKLRGLRHEGTGTWLLHNSTFIAWKESMSSEGLFIHGIPGSGKSVLTSLIVDDHLEGPNRPNTGTLYFYCDYANSPTLQPVHIYRAFLQQLFFKGLLKEPIVKEVVETLRVNVNGLSEQKVTGLICNAIESCAGLHVILDGLDECERDVQIAVTSALCRSLAAGHHLMKLLITCRDEGHLLGRFSNFARLQVTSQASAADIESYMSHAVSSSISSGALTLRNPALKDEITAELVSKAQGMFLWVHFQLVELCDEASDEGIRNILEQLPEGLYETYTRIFRKIAKTESKTTVLRIMMWMVCAKRLLRVEELQEAVAFDSHDKSWNADKVPNRDKIIKSCHGLVVRDTENSSVRLAHHTVHQYLVSPQIRLQATSAADFEETTPRADFWPELYKFRYDPETANVMAARLCAAYLCFSDFGTAVSRIQDGKKVDLTSAFKDRGPVCIPAASGLNNYLHNLPSRFFGGNKNFKMPDIDYSKYVNVKPQCLKPSADFREKFALLEYVIQYWHEHIRWLKTSSDPGFTMRFWNLVQHGTLAFEFRPWGLNQYFGRYGCKGCPVLDSGDLEPKTLPSMGLVHWAAEAGQLEVFDTIEPPLEQYLNHERYHDETLLIACRHGQPAVVELLLNRRKFDLSDTRAIVAACASGDVHVLERLLQVHEAKRTPNNSWTTSSTYILREIGPVVLYQAANSGHDDIVRFLLGRKIKSNFSDPTTGLTPLQIAAKNGYTQVVDFLVGSQPPDINIDPPSIDSPHRTTGMKALPYAAVGGCDEVVALLVNHGFGCDQVDVLGETPLIKASKNGQATVAKTLLEGGADPFVPGGEQYQLASQEYFERFGQSPSAYDRDGEIEVARRPTAIHHAAANGHDNVIKVLPYSDRTCGDQVVNALHLGAAFGHPDVVQSLLCKGANTEIKDHAGMNALHHASYNGHNRVVDLLLSRGSEIHRKTDIGLTALHLAAWAAKGETIKLLVAYGAAIDARTSDIIILRATYPAYTTSLHLAARRDNADIIRILVKCGASLEKADLFGLTALHEAIWPALPANVLVLIELGAEWIRSYVFSRAVEANDTKIVEILLSKLATATVEEQRKVASVIKGMLATATVEEQRKAASIKGMPNIYGENSKSTNQNLRLLKNWQRGIERLP